MAREWTYAGGTVFSGLPDGVDLATQAELDAAVADLETQIGQGGGGGAVSSVNGETGAVVLDATDVGAATAADISTHSADTTSVHGITDTSALVLTDDSRLSDARTPTTHTHAESEITGLVSDLAGKQPLDSDLTAIAALTTTATGRSLLAAADAAAIRTISSAHPLGGLQLPDTFVCGIHPTLFSGVSNVGGANGGKSLRVVVPKTGNLRDVAVYVGVSSGNVDVGVYSTASTRAKLWSSGSVACPAANGWGIVGDPNLAVTAGQQLDLWLSCDNTTATFGRVFVTNAAQSTLPTGFWPANGAEPKINGQANSVFPLPSTIAEASITNNSYNIALIARVS